MADDRGRENPISTAYPEWTKLNQWLAAGKQVSIICNQLPCFGDTSLPRARRFAELLLPHVRPGELTLKHAQPYEGTQSDSQRPSMVLIDQATGKTSLLYEINRPDAVLNQLWAESMLLREVTAEEAKQYDVSCLSIQAKDLESPETIQRFHYKSHEARPVRQSVCLPRQQRNKGH